MYGVAPRRPPVIAGELAERAFGEGLVRIEMAFEDDLGMRRQRQAGEVGGEQLDRRALDPGIILVLALGLRQAGRADEKQQRIDAVGRGDRRRLAHLPPLVAVGAGILAGRGVDADLARALDHHPIGADVDRGRSRGPW